MRRVYCFFLFFCVSSLWAQQTDSAYSRNKVLMHKTADSLKQKQTEKAKQKFTEQKNGGDSLMKLKRAAVSNTVNIQKTALRQKTDSTARVSYKTKTATLLKEEAKPLTSAKAKGIQKVNNALKKPEVKPLLKKVVKLSGEIRSESYATTAQNPMMRNEPYYSRLYIAPSLSLFGLPFRASFFLTTENNNTYSSNFFTFKLDVNALRQQAAADIQKQIEDAKNLDRLREIDLQKNAMQTQRYEQELKGLQNQIPDADAMQQALRKQAEEKSKSYIEQQQKAAEEKLKSASEEEKQKIEAELKRQSDSIINHYKQEGTDSLMNAKGQYEDKVDTAQLGKYLRMQNQLDELKAKRQEIETLRHQDSVLLVQNTKGVRNPDDLRKMAKEQMPGNAFIRSALAVERFGLGIVNPQYGEFTLFAASVKGLDIGINKDKTFYDITIGKTTRQFTGPFSSVKPVFDRYLGVARYGIGELKGNHIAAEYLYAFDKESHEPGIPIVSNGVLNLRANFTVLKNTRIEASAAQSTYKEQYTGLTTTQSIGQGNATESLSAASANRAYSIKASQTLTSNSKLEASVKQTGAAFRTVGNPFLRRNFREAEFKFEQQLLKKKIKFSAFYKEMRDNLIELNKATNRMNGYGLKLTTAFEKYPNISLGYSPYQQGNNHPDSIYRTNNQFSITTAVLTYKKKYRGSAWNGLLSYTRSAMQINNGNTIAYRLVSTVHNFQWGLRHNTILTYLSNVTTPFVDSLNSQSVQFTHTYRTGKSSSLGLLGEQTTYKNGALKAGGGMQITASLFRNFTFNLLARYDRIHKLWNLDNADVFTGRVVLVWRW